jgi:hypothetical protein
MQKARKSLFGPIAAGFFVVLPVLLVGLVFEKIYHALHAVVYPLMDAFPGVVFRHPVIRALAMVAAIVALLQLKKGGSLPELARSSSAASHSRASTLLPL